MMPGKNPLKKINDPKFEMKKSTSVKSKGPARLSKEAAAPRGKFFSKSARSRRSI